MVFLDEVEILARSGDGGRGCVSFRAERFIPKGGPDGGDGGSGGDIIVKAHRNLSSLSAFRYRKQFRAADGQPGKGQNQTGKNGADLVLRVPPGTVVEDAQSGQILAELLHDAQTALILPGGKGGKGNQHFVSSTRRAPKISQSGTPGMEKRLRLNFKTLTDIGLVGLPNVGKSTLLSRLTGAHPKIDHYPFTTLSPNLGVMILEDGPTVVLADIPGLVEGASSGRGLGHGFLKHIERSELLLLVLDLTFNPKDHPLEDLLILRNELREYDTRLAEKPYIVVINKMDLPPPEKRPLDLLKSTLHAENVASGAVSARTGQGIEQLKAMICDHLFTSSQPLRPAGLPGPRPPEKDPERNSG